MTSIPPSPPFQFPVHDQPRPEPTIGNRASRLFRQTLPKLGGGALMKIGVPVVGMTSTLISDTVAPGEQTTAPRIAISVGIGAIAGAGWGAGIGGLIPKMAGPQATRLEGAFFGARKGVLMAPAMAVTAKLLIDETVGDKLPRNRQ